MKAVARSLAVATLASFAVAAAQAAPTYVNGLTIDGRTLDASGGTTINDGRLGFFSDIYYDALRNEWYALSDRGPGGGTLPYEVRVHRFTIDIDRNSGAISNFQVRRTLILRKGGLAFNGLAPPVAGPLGNALDPEGVVVQPLTGNLLISDEYGPALYEFTRSGQFLRAFKTPANLAPRNAATGVVNYASDAGNTAGKRTNRGFEGLAIGPGGLFVYAMLQSPTLDEGGADGLVTRIVKFNAITGRAVAQYAYVMEGNSQGRGISALVAINDHQFLVLERNNRGLGVDTNLASPNKKVYRIDLAGATDVTNIDLDSPTAAYTAVMKQNLTPWLDLAAPGTLADPSLAALGGVSPEKIEGLAIGPRLKDGSYLVLVGSDNDYSVTQNASSVQFEVLFNPAPPAGQTRRIQCDLGSAFANCSGIKDDGTSAGPVPSTTFVTSGYRPNPGVLHAYKATTDDLRSIARLELPWLRWESYRFE